MPPREGTRAAAWLTALALALAVPAGAQGPAPAVDTAVKAMSLAAGGNVSVTRSPLSGLATFVSVPPGRAIPVLDPSAVTPAERAVAFLDTYGQAFGLESASQLLVVATPPTDEAGMDHVRFRQVHGGLPVTAGEIWVHLRGPGVVAANGKTLPLPRELDLRPGVSAEAAIEGARLGLAKDVALDGAEFGTPRLEILNRGLLDGRMAPTHLAWFVEVTGEALREYAWVDARTGSVILHFSQLTHGKNRAIYNAFSTNALPGSLMRTEGGPATGDADADYAYTYLGDTYDYFWTQHGRDSWNGGGAPLIATVHYCPNASSCPYGNAFWNGSQMVFGNGFSAADDVDAHELTHAVTETSANLFYYMQSGALNESYSDIFGEAVDLSNTGGTDSAGVRWLMGEDVPGLGAIRNMMNPNQFGDPGRMKDGYLVCATPGGDGGGVHTNSGIPNHAFALMTDGGSFNGYTITGIGLTKAGKIQYRALTRYLVSGSDFLDNYNALKQSCTDLVGTSGITSGDCTEVGKALDAVEMDDPWNCSPIQPVVPDLCTFGQAPQTLFFDNFEAGLVYWSTPIARGSFPWTLGSFLGPYATSGANMLWGYDAYNVTDSRAEMIYPVAIPSGDIRVQFNHSYGFDNGSYTLWDGGVIEYTLDGVSWGDAGAWITQGASYRGTIAGGYQNPLAGRAGFGFDSFGYTASQLNISGLAGQNVRFRFRIGADNSYDDYGWFVDDVRIYKCVAAQVQVASPNGGESLPGGSTQLVTWTGATTPDGTLEVYYNDGVTRTLLAKLAGTARSYLWTVPTATTTTGKIEIESKVKAGTEATDQSDATFSITAPAPLPPKVDFNGDGQSDILWHHQGDGSLYTWWLQGTVTTAGSYLTPPAFSDTKWQIRGVADFNKDGQQDILWHHQATGDLYVWYLNGTVVIDGSYLTPQSFSDTKWQIRGVADFDRDGSQDILWHHQGTGDLYVWRLGGLKGVVVQGGSYLNPSRFADTLWQIRAVIDFTKDGKPDLLWHHQGNGDLYLWAMDGYAVKWGSYLTPSRFADTRWQIRRVADFNADGQLDLLWHHQTNGQLYVWMLQNLVTTAGSYLTPSAFTDVRWQIMPR